MWFERHDLLAALGEVGAEAWAAGKVIDLCVYGGSCLMLVSDFRVASADVDAVAVTDQGFVDQIARAIAERHGWPGDWLNDGVRTYLSPAVDAPDHHLMIGTYPSEQTPGLRVYVPTAEYMLAMKLMAMRIDAASDSKDLDDIVNLMQVVGIRSGKDLVDAASRYYPEAKVSAKLLLSANSLIAQAQSRKTLGHETPRYFGGGRDGGDGG